MVLYFDKKTRKTVRVHVVRDLALPVPLPAVRTAPPAEPVDRAPPKHAAGFAERYLTMNNIKRKIK